MGSGNSGQPPGTQHAKKTRRMTARNIATSSVAFPLSHRGMYARRNEMSNMGNSPCEKKRVRAPRAPLAPEQKKEGYGRVSGKLRLMPYYRLSVHALYICIFYASPNSLMDRGNRW
ncbi:MAG: hypothetical protein MZV63_63125 [Marinilabiliales bacterium]|nr:hypothetical protein [Marinilabiliales bacterium]